MSNPKNLKNFQQNYCTALIPEHNSKSFFIKVSVTDYNELGIIKTNLITAIDLINRFHEISKNSDRSEIVYATDTLIQLLRNFSMMEEYDGLTEILKNRPS